jgi:uncharacterized BrkB/YihY/UPF0761 family membrane protein
MTVNRGNRSRPATRNDVSEPRAPLPAAVPAPVADGPVSPVPGGGTAAADGPPAGAPAARAAGGERRLARVRRQAAAWAGVRSSAAREWLLANVPHGRLAMEVLRRWKGLNATLLAGNLTYRLFLWLLPLLLVVVAAMGFESNETVSSITGGSLGLSRELAVSIGDAARDAGTSASHALAVGILGLIFASRSLIVALHLTFSHVWGLPATTRRGMPAAVAKFVTSLPLAFVILAASLGIRRLGVIGGLSSQGLAFLFGSGALLTVNWVLPRRTDSWRELLPGSVLGGIVLVIARHTALYYFENHAARASKVYGSLGVVAGFLSALFVFSVIIVLNALVNVVWHERNGLEPGDLSEPETEPETDPAA